jgi:carboxyl-terminal processing protease
MQQFYRPNGDSTQNRGVVSDIELPSITTHLDVAESDLDYAMKFDKVPSVGYQRANYVQPAVVDQVRRRSMERRSNSADFQKVDRDITRYLAQKNRKTVSLNEAKFMADREELDARKEEEKKLDELNNTTTEVVKKDYYFHETVAITLDYLQLMPVARAR